MKTSRACARSGSTRWYVCVCGSIGLLLSMKRARASRDSWQSHAQNAPELLPYDDEIVSEMLDQIKNQVRLEAFVAVLCRGRELASAWQTDHCVLTLRTGVDACVGGPSKSTSTR